MPIPCPIRFVHPFPNAEDRVNRCHILFEVLDGHLVAPKYLLCPPPPRTENRKGGGGGYNMCLVAENIVQRCWNLLTTVSIAISFPPSRPISPWQVTQGSKPFSVFAVGVSGRRRRPPGPGCCAASAASRSASGWAICPFGPGVPCRSRWHSGPPGSSGPMSWPTCLRRWAS